MLRRRPALALLLLLAALAGVLAACSDDDDSGGSVTIDDLDDRSFVVTSAEGQTIVDGSEVRISFADGFVNVQGGCNSISGAIDVEDSTISFSGQPIGTLIGCEPDLQAQDEWLTALFTDGAEATLDGDALTLTGDGVTLELEEDGSADEASATDGLTGTIWLLSAIDGVERPGGVQAPTLQLGADGRALVFTGCNNGSASYQEADETLTFEPLVLTRIACEGETAEVEAAQSTLLDGEVSYTVEDGTLTLTKGDQTLTYRAG